MKARLLLAGLALAALLCGALWRSSARAPRARLAAAPEGAPDADLDRRATALEPAAPVAPERGPAPAARVPVAAAATAAAPRWHGRVVDAESGAPVAGAMMWLGRGRRGGPRRVASGPDGRFPPLELPLQRARKRGRSDPGVPLRHPSYVATSVRLAAGHESPERERVISLEPAAELDLCVVGSRGRARAGLTVLVVLAPGAAGEAPGAAVRGQREPAGTGTTDAAGRSVLRGLPPRRALALEVRSEDGSVLARYPERVVLAPRELRALDWIVPEPGTGCRVAGRVVDVSGAPAPGLEVWLAWEADVGDAFDASERPLALASARSDERGAFAFEDVAPGRMLVGVAPRQPGVASLAALLEVPAVDERSAAEIVVELVAERGLFLRGRVLGPLGRPVARCVLVASSAEPRFEARATSGSGGAFELGPLLAGEYVVEARPAEVVVRHACAPRPIVARPGEDEVVIRLGAGGSLSGRVVASGGGAARSSVRATVRLCTDPPAAAPRAVVDEHGGFRFDHLEPGLYSLAAASEDGGHAFASRVAVGALETASVELALAPGARLVLDAPAGVEDALVLAWSLAACVRAERVAPGRRTAWTVPPGALSLQVLAGPDDSALALVQELALELAAGERRRVRLAPFR